MTTRHCATPVPDALRGNLGPATCRLPLDDNGIHAGKHKAHLTVPKLGRVTFHWRTGWLLNTKRRFENVSLPAPHWHNAKARNTAH